LYNFVGTAGTPIDSWPDVTLVNKRAQEAKIPFRGRNCIVDPAAEAELWELTQFHAANVRGDGGTALEQAQMGRVLGIDWYMNQNVTSHTSGVAGAGPFAVDDAADVAAGETTVHIDGLTANTGQFVVGDLITFAGHDTQYRVTATVTADANGDVDAVIEPALTDGVADDEVVTKVGDHTENCLFHRNCFALAVVPLELPSGAADAQYIQSRGMGLRLVSGYDMTTKKDTVSLDVLVGAKCIQPELGIRVLG
jgi:hypothetical protein